MPGDQSVARTVLAWAAILASAAWSVAHAHDEPDQTAMAIPRIEVPSHPGAEAALPQPLNPSDAARVRRIFADQVHGRIAAAQQETGQLSDQLLLGTILAERYLGPFHKATVSELSAWLARYADQPEASAIHALLARRLPRAAHVPPFHPPACLAPAAADRPAPPPTGSDHVAVRSGLLDREVAQRVAAGEYATALRLIAHTPGLHGTDGALLRAVVARGLFTANRDDAAMELGMRAWRSTGRETTVAAPALIAGLAAWRLGRIDQARTLFADAAAAATATPAQRAAAAFWAARAEAQSGRAGAARSWLERAAAGLPTFYSLVARDKLGWPIGAVPERGVITEADLEALDATQAGRRAFALLEVGQSARAEQTLRCLWPAVAADPGLRRSLLLLAAESGFFGLASQIDDLIAADDGQQPDDFDVPVPSLRPAGGFRFDPALVYGLTRVESNFDADAVSAAGARGLMQIMPITARAVTGEHRIADARLRDGGFNLELGQRWIESLAGKPVIGGDLISLLASYNDGLGGFLDWRGEIRAQGDPFLFIEAIPIQQTREFVERTLTYTWIYAARLGLPSPGLRALARDEFPRFTPGRPGRTIPVSVH